MLRKVACVAVLLCLAGAVMAQKDKKEYKPTKPTYMGKVVSVNTEKNILVVDHDGKKESYIVGKATKILGPRGGKTDLKDERLKAGAEVGIVADGKKLKEVQLQTRKDKK
jgi:hypothetical protein